MLSFLLAIDKDEADPRERGRSSQEAGDRDDAHRRLTGIDKDDVQVPGDKEDTRRRLHGTGYDISEQKKMGVAGRQSRHS